MQKPLLRFAILAASFIVFGIVLIFINRSSEISGLQFLGNTRNDTNSFERVEFVKSKISPALGLNFPWEKRVMLADGESQVAELRKAIRSQEVSSGEANAFGPFSAAGTLVLYSDSGIARLQLYSSSKGFWRISVSDVNGPGSSILYYSPEFSKILELSFPN